MQENQKKSQQIYDHVVIGSGLSGLLVATSLSQHSPNVLLLEGLENYGGLNRPQDGLLGPTNNGLRFLPDSELAVNAADFVQNLMDLPIGAKSEENPLITYEAGGFRPFLGFGENPPPFYEELLYFLSPKQLSLALQPLQWPQALFNKFKGEFLPRSYVTKFHEDGDSVTAVTINGQKTVRAKHFVYCGPVQDLLVLLPENGLSAKAKQKLSRGKFWTALCLDFLHGQTICQNTAMHVLNGANQDEVGHCVGRFQETQADGTQISQWVTFLEHEDAEDSELVGQTLRKMKRQLKRIYPQALDGLKFERILLAPSIAGSGDLKLNANQTLPPYINFWLGSGTVNAQRNLLGALLQAEMVTNSILSNQLAAQKGAEAVLSL